MRRSISATASRPRISARSARPRAQCCSARETRRVHTRPTPRRSRSVQIRASVSTEWHRPVKPPATQQGRARSTTKFLIAWKNSDENRPELAHARAYLAQEEDGGRCFLAAALKQLTHEAPWSLGDWSAAICASTCWSAASSAARRCGFAVRAESICSRCRSSAWRARSFGPSIFGLVSTGASRSACCSSTDFDSQPFDILPC